MILEINQLISIELKVGIKAIDNTLMVNDYYSYFTTEMSPMYSSALAVKKYVGGHSSSVPDDTINQLILEYSILAQDLSDCLIDDRWERYAGEWVTYKTALIILQNTPEFKETSAGKNFKQLGDFSISTGATPTDIAGLIKLINWLECQAYKYEIALRYCTQPAINCEGMTNTSAIPYVSKNAKLVERGDRNINKALPAREWIAYNDEPIATNKLIAFGKKYSTNLGRTYTGGIYYGGEPIRYY